MRTNKYLVSGTFIQKTFAINEPKGNKNFSMAVTVTDIANETSAETILQTCRAIVSEAVQKTGSMKLEQLHITNCCLLDSFEQETPVIPIQTITQA